MRFIIDFAKNVTLEQIQQYLTANQCTVEKVFSAFDHVYVVDSAVQPPDTELTDFVIDEAAQPISLMSESMTWDTQTLDDWWKVASCYRPDLTVPTYVAERRTAAAQVYIVDSGIKLDHPEFAGADITNLFSFNGDFTDYNGHGTALTSVVVGSTCGVVNAPVKSVKIFQSGVETMLSHLVSAFDAILQDAALTPNKLHVVNLSWSIPKNLFIESKIQDMLNAGMVVICSAGNNGTPIQDVTPASMPDVITVGAYNHDFVPCDFSDYTGYLDTALGQVNYGALDVWAPGQDIRVAALAGGVAVTSGTSIAAAVQTACVVFNSSLLQMSDGSISAQVNNKDGVLSVSIGKAGMLTLTAPHDGGVNEIGLIQSRMPGINYFPKPATGSQKFVINNVPVAIQLFPFGIFKSASGQNLPAGLSMDGNHLVGTTQVTEIQQIDVDIPVVTFDDIALIYKLNLILLPQEMPKEDLPAEITLNAICGPLSASCDGDCAGGNTCYDCVGLKDGGYCQCISHVGCP